MQGFLFWEEGVLLLLFVFVVVLVWVCGTPLLPSTTLTCQLLLPAQSQLLEEAVFSTYNLCLPQEMEVRGTGFPTPSTHASAGVCAPGASLAPTLLVNRDLEILVSFLD